MIFLSASLLPSGCTTLEPYIQEFNIVSVQDEIKMGQMMQEQVAKEMQVLQDPSLEAKINRIGQNLLTGLPTRTLPYRFFVVNDATPNAFTIPGGAIYVHTGLIKFADNEAQIAGVMAHEIGHAYLRHPARSVSRAYGLQYLSQLIWNQSNTPAKKSAGSTVVGKLLETTLMTRYGRSDEYQADDYGYYLMTKSSYSPSGMVEFFRKLQKIQGSGGPAFLSSHPPTPDRIARLEARIHNNQILSPQKAG